jgi:hypothetical protein
LSSDSLVCDCTGGVWSACASLPRAQQGVGGVPCALACIERYPDIVGLYHPAAQPKPGERLCCYVFDAVNRFPSLVLEASAVAKLRGCYVDGRVKGFLNFGFLNEVANRTFI